MKVLAFPRSPNPYQDDLYGAMAALGPLTLRYIGERTPSQTLNLAALPLELLVGRARGYRVLHLHWVYTFAPVWARNRVARRAMRAWFSMVLVTAAMLGIRVVWTAHNLVPHEPVFDDDEAARRALVRRCATVIAHTTAVAETLATWGARQIVVIPPGATPPPVPVDRAAACDRLGLPSDVFRVVHFGVVREYKGVDTLIAAAEQLPAHPPVQVVVVGDCPDDDLRSLLTTAGQTLGPERLDLRLAHVSDEELDAHLAAADVAAFPFRAVTSSSSVGRALAAGVPVIVPTLDTLADISRAAAVRYAPDDGAKALVAAITELATGPAERLGSMSVAARRSAEAWSWPDCAHRTWQVFRHLHARGHAGVTTPVHAEVAR